MHLCYSINFIPGSHCLNKDCGLDNVAGGNLHEPLFQETSLTRSSWSKKTVSGTILGSTLKPIPMCIHQGRLIYLDGCVRGNGVEPTAGRITKNKHQINRDQFWQPSN